MNGVMRSQTCNRREALQVEEEQFDDGDAAARNPPPEESAKENHQDLVAEDESGITKT